MNSLGFVGFQRREALHIDLGYYDSNILNDNGAAKNTWDGTWIGKNGVNFWKISLPKRLRQSLFRRRLANLQIVENGLKIGKSMDDFLGKTTSYTDGSGATVTVELTLTGILAAAHLRGAYGTLNLLQNGAVSTDEYGTPILP
ncbi:hypothetical protein [Ruegeria sp. Ofav3-42]|uniref:hypothetical protein n=1 Tax=Ruegeria sp. Ofav3-42 TaxID=2917759 RepID=UPI001EF7214C|nr:hypothetical protein [Ruegeria sp. Ofav3-42]MCG7522228.1 hypothetical protein [Ruegeria sp. Ofav3-42]